MNLDKIVSAHKELGNRVLKNPHFLHIPPDDLKLNSLVLSYFDGKNWKIISIDDAIQYPIIQDKFYNDKTTEDGIGEINKISVTFCPFSFSGIVYFGVLRPSNKVYNNNMLLKYSELGGSLIQQLTGNAFSKKTGKKKNYFIRKGEVKILELRSALSQYPDCIFLHNKKKVNPIVSINYITSKNILYPHNKKVKTYPPKKIVYGILYVSSNTNVEERRDLVVISKEDEIDYVKAGYSDYFSSVLDELRDKGGFIVPCFWFAWNQFYPNSNRVEI